MTLVSSTNVLRPCRAAVEPLNFRVEADFVERIFDRANVAVVGRHSNVVENVAFRAALVLLTKKVQIVDWITFSLKFILRFRPAYFSFNKVYICGSYTG